MSKLELTQTQVKRIENSTSDTVLLMFPIDMKIPIGYIPQGMSRKENEPYSYNMWNDKLKDVIFLDMPIQIGDKDIFVQEGIILKECIDIRVVRVQDIHKKKEINSLGISLNCMAKKKEERTSGNEMLEMQRLDKMLIESYNNQLKEANTNRTYEDNDYIFLVEFKR